MYGSLKFQLINGRWDHVGYCDTSEVYLPSSSVNSGVLPKGTALNYKNGNDQKAQLASGMAVGFTTQDITLEGQASLQSFKDRTIGKTDLPIAVGQNVSLRMPTLNSELEVEGSGVAQPGNLVCTSGTGALASNTARRTKLSFLNGSFRIAQTGDVAQFLLLETGLTANIDGNLRIRVRRVDLGIV